MLTAKLTIVLWLINVSVGVYDYPEYDVNYYQLGKDDYLTDQTYYDSTSTTTPVNEIDYCICILYRPNANITLYRKDGDSLFSPEETLDEVMLYKLYNLGTLTDVNVIYEPRFLNYKLCLVVVDRYSQPDYVEVFLPWWSYTRWINKTEWNVEEPCTPCLCTEHNSTHLWEIYRNKGIPYWSFNSTGEYRTCLRYKSTNALVDGGSNPNWIRVAGHAVMEDNGLVSFNHRPGYIFHIERLNDTVCYDDEDIITEGFGGVLSVVDVESTIASTQTVIPTQEISTFGESCYCLTNNPLRSTGWLVSSNTCVYLSMTFEKPLDDSTTRSFLLQNLICPEEARYYLNETHLIECHKGYRYSLLKTRYSSVLDRNLLNFQVCQKFSLNDNARITNFQLETSADEIEDSSFLDIILIDPNDSQASDYEDEEGGGDNTYTNTTSVFFLHFFCIILSLCHFFYSYINFS